MFVVCCVLCVVCWSLVARYWSWFVVCCLLVGSSLLVVCCSLFVDVCVVCFRLWVVRSLLFVAC